MVKREKTLKDFDDLPLEKIDGESFEITPMPNVDKVLNAEKICKKCNGDLEEVSPLIMMGSLKLYECKECRERIYL